MAKANQEQDNAPQQPALPVEDTERDQGEHEGLGNPPVDPAKESIGHVTAVELAHRK